MKARLINRLTYLLTALFVIWSVSEEMLWHRRVDSIMSWFEVVIATRRDADIQTGYSDNREVDGQTGGQTEPRRHSTTWRLYVNTMQALWRRTCCQRSAAASSQQFCPS